MATETALDRVQRILELIPYLRGRTEKIVDLAEEFRVPADVITRDLEIAFMSGLPGYTPDLLIDVLVDTDIASVLDPQSLDLPPAMDKTQMVTLLLGLQLLVALVEMPEASRSVTTRLIARVEGLLGSDPIKEISLEDFEREKKIVEAIFNRQNITFDYLPFTGVASTNRKVLALEIYWRSGQSLLKALELKTMQTRNFFLSRMSNIVLGNRENPQRALSVISQQDPMCVDVVLSEDALWWTKRYAAFITQSTVDSQNGRISISFEFWDEAWAIRSLASINDCIHSVLGLPGFAEKIREYLEFTV
ncbi:MAG: hypothetical protein RL540_276 [Actinomycetota bacterium]